MLLICILLFTVSPLFSAIVCFIFSCLLFGHERRILLDKLSLDLVHGSHLSKSFGILICSMSIEASSSGCIHVWSAWHFYFIIIHYVWMRHRALRRITTCSIPYSSELRLHLGLLFFPWHHTLSRQF